MSLLTQKEREKLERTRKTLLEGGNPFSQVSAVTYKSNSDVHKPIDSKKVRKARLTKWNRKVGKHEWSFIDGQADVTPVNGPVCISCKQGIQIVKSIYGKIVVNLAQRIVDTVNSAGLDVKRVLTYPVFSTGYVCQQCADTLYRDTYHDQKGSLHRGIELLIPHTPVPVSKSFKSKDDDIDRGKGEVISVTDVILDHGEIIEEWKTSLPRVEREPVDVNSYRYFNRGRR